MSRLIRLAAAATAITALGAAPANAQTTPQPPCDNVPACVSYTHDTVERTLDWLQRNPEGSVADDADAVVDDAACLAYEVLTEEPCQQP